MKVALVETSDYLSGLIDRAGTARGKAVVAALLLFGAAAAFAGALLLLSEADRLVGEGAPQVVGTCAGWSILPFLLAGFAGFCALLAGKFCQRIVREATPVRYIALAEGITIDLPEGDRR